MAAKDKRAERQRTLVQFVLDAQNASVADLAAHAGVSVMTVHRDIEELVAQGLLRRFHGGVSALPTSAFESSVSFRMQQNVAAKESLARTALALIEPGMSLMLDDSTTVYALAALLADYGHLTVISNFRRIADLFVDSSDIQLFVIGGRYSRTHDSYVSPASLTGLDTYKTDIVFQSSSTMDPTQTYHQEQDVVEMKRVMLAAGRRRVLMMDGSKVGKTSLHRYADIAEFTDIIVTDDVSADVIERLRDVVTVHIADAE